MTYIPRILAASLRQQLARFSVVGVTGPRQSGKSTLLQHTLGNKYRYVTFDDYKMIDLLHHDPDRFLRMYDDRVVFDEVQKVPELFPAIKLAVDADRKRRGKFVLTGSSQFSFIKGITESLAGRIGLISLLPFEFREIPHLLRTPSVFRGCYPEVVSERFRRSTDWYSSYLETYVNRDVRHLSAIGNLRDFRRCLQMLAARTGQILSLSELARDVGVSVPTIRQWISILEASYILFLLAPYYRNLGKRLVKSPKVFFYDTGLVSFLTGVDSQRTFQQGPMHGPIFENYVIAEIKKHLSHTNANAELFYFRTSHGVEVDLIIDRRRSLDLIEVKSSESFRPAMLQNISILKRKTDRAFLVYQGKSLPSADSIAIQNYSEFLESL
jgi:hypothetical protein